MIYPSIEELTEHGKYNRYTLVVATAKCARMVTDEYVQQREEAEKKIANKETDKKLDSMIEKEHRDDKAVKVAIRRIYRREVDITLPPEGPEEHLESLDSNVADRAAVVDESREPEAESDNEAETETEEEEN